MSSPCTTTLLLLILAFHTTGGQSHRLFQRESLKQQQLSNAHDMITTVAATSPSPSCPCDTPTLCTPVQGPPRNEKGEVFGFVNKNTDPASLNWTHITTVAWGSTPEMMCAAHSHGARVVVSSPSVNLTLLTNVTKRQQWVATAVSLVITNFYDGMVFDYESPQLKGSIEGATYALVVADTRRALQKLRSSYQVSTCVAWSPDNIDGRVSLSFTTV